MQLTPLCLKLCIQQKSFYPYGGFGEHESIPHVLSVDAFYNIASFFFNFPLNFEGQVWAAHMVLYTFLYVSGTYHNCSHRESSSSNILSTQNWRRLLRKRSYYLHKLTKYKQKYRIMYTGSWCTIFFFLHLLLTIHNRTAVFSL